MRFFFIRDYKRKYRYFSSGPLRTVRTKPSKSKQAWDLAKKKLQVLPFRTLRQEQAFGQALTLKGLPLQIVHSSSVDEKKIGPRFTLFLQKQKTIHILVLACELLLLPLSALAAVLPGPNLLFYSLALLMATQWQALRGIHRTLKAEHRFIPEKLIEVWESAVEEGQTERFPELLSLIDKELGTPDVLKLLWTKKRKKR